MKTINNPGTDYSFGMANRDDKGIRFGVINQSEILQAWADSSEPDYGSPACPYCGSEDIVEIDPDISETWRCEDCCEKFEDWEKYGETPIGHSYEQEGYIAYCGDDGDIFVEKSPFYTYAKFCSPCAPGAGYLMEPFTCYVNPIKYPSYYQHKAITAGFPKVYCFDHDWFWDHPDHPGRAPYPVFRVDTGEVSMPIES